MAEPLTLDLPDVVARLTDSAPPTPAAPPRILRRICAWCPDFDPTSPDNQHATHTICPTCFARLRAAEAKP